MTVSVPRRTVTSLLTVALVASCWMATLALQPQPSLPTPEKFLGFRVGADNKLARWDKIVEYMQLVAAGSPRVQVRELGKTTNGNPFIAVEIAAPDTLAEPRPLQAARSASSTSRTARRPTPSATRSSATGKAVVARHVQHPLDRDRRVADGARAGAPAGDRGLAAREEDPRQRDLPARAEPQPGRPDHGDRLVQQEPRAPSSRTSPMPWLYHPYVGHDNNRDMYMFTQKESQLTARLLWHDWFPAVWLDEHQMGSSRRAHLRDAGDRSDQPERAPADLPLERHPRPGAGGGARGGRQGRHHLQLDLHQLLAGRDGVERLVAQPGRPAHRGRERARRGADRAAAGRSRARRRRPPEDGQAQRRRRRRTRTRRCRRRATSRRAPSTRGPGWAAAGRCATSSTTS